MIEYDKLFLDGRWVSSHGTGTLSVVDSTTEEVMGRFPEGDPDELIRSCTIITGTFTRPIADSASASSGSKPASSLASSRNCWICWAPATPRQSKLMIAKSVCVTRSRARRPAASGGSAWPKTSCGRPACARASTTASRR